MDNRQLFRLDEKLRQILEKSNPKIVRASRNYQPNEIIGGNFQCANEITAGQEVVLIDNVAIGTIGFIENSNQVTNRYSRHTRPTIKPINVPENTYFLHIFADINWVSLINSAYDRLARFSEKDFSAIGRVYVQLIFHPKSQITLTNKNIQEIGIETDIDFLDIESPVTKNLTFLKNFTEPPITETGRFKVYSFSRDCNISGQFNAIDSNSFPLDFEFTPEANTPRPEDITIIYEKTEAFNNLLEIKVKNIKDLGFVAARTVVEILDPSANSFGTFLVEAFVDYYRKEGNTEPVRIGRLNSSFIRYFTLQELGNEPLEVVGRIFKREFGTFTKDQNAVPKLFLDERVFPFFEITGEQPIGGVESIWWRTGFLKPNDYEV